MDHLEVNRQVTLKSLETNRTPDVIQSVMGRLQDVYDIAEEYMWTDMDILDIGTKDCLFFDLLVEKGHEQDKLIGIDCCTEVVDMCKDKGYLVYEVDAQETLLPDNSFDIIFIVHTLEHVPSPEAVILECGRLLKPDGFLFIEVPIQQYEDPELWGHYHTFGSHDEVKSLMGEYRLLKEDWQKTQSKKPWYRVLFQKVD